MSFLQRVARRLHDHPPYYKAPEGDLLRLDQNTNRWGPHPAARNRPAMDEANLYPHRDNRPLLAAFAQAHGVAPGQVFAGNGSDEILDVIIRVLVEPGGRVVTPRPSYSLFGHICRLNRVEHSTVAYDDGFRFDAEALLAKDPDLVLIADPENPSGTRTPWSTVERLLDGFDGPVVIDEAYGDYAPESVLRHIGNRENLIVTHTLSKAYGLAGLRVGFGVAHETVAELVRRAKIPFSVNTASQEWAVAALRQPEPVRHAVRLVAEQRARLAAALAGRGFHVTPSQANFILTRPPLDAEVLRAKLAARGVLARTFPGEPMLRDRVRFTVGPAQEVDRLLASIDHVLAEDAG